MSAIFRGTYRRLGSFDASGALAPAAGTVAVTPLGGSTVTATLDAAGAYEITLTTVTGPIRATLVETLTDAPAVRTTSRVVTTGEVVDTSWEFHPTSSIDTLEELAAALAGKQDTIPSGTYVPINGAGLGGATASDQQLKDWVTSEAYEVTAATRDANDVVTTATVKWPDGSAGTFTTVTANATFLTIDAYSVSHTLSGKTVTQAAVTRNANGAVTVKPALTVA